MQPFLFIKESTLIIVNKFWAPIQPIRMISEGSCDTETANMPAENMPALPINYISDINIDIKI